MSEIPVIDFEAVLDAVPPKAAIDAVRTAFIKHAEGSWRMPPKVYLDASPHGDFRAMPALGEGLAILKWVTSFPDNPASGRPVVFGTIVVSDAATGEPVALVDGRAVTALRTGAAAAVATAELAAEGAQRVGLVGCGLHGRWAGTCLVAAGYTDGVCFDTDPAAARDAARELGWRSGTLTEALAADIVTLVTPGRKAVVGVGDLSPGAHVNAMGADGSGKAEMAVDEVLRCQVFCDEWAQASHGGELTRAVTSGRLARPQVVELGRVLLGEAPGREDSAEITLFDSTGLAIQDLAVTAEVIARWRSGDLDAPTISL